MPNRVNRKYCALFDAYAAKAKATDIYSISIVTILPLFSFPLGSFAPLNFLHSVYLCFEARISVQNGYYLFTIPRIMNLRSRYITFFLILPVYVCVGVGEYVAVTVAKH